jgi:hypothetical protein
MKRFLLFLVFAVLFGGYAFAYDFSAVSSGKTLYYNITSSTSPYTVEVTYQIDGESNGDYVFYTTYPTGNLTIPSSVTYSGITYSVNRIGDYAFLGCSGLTSVTIPNSVTSIGGYAFWETGWFNNQSNGILYLDGWCLGYKLEDEEQPTGILNITGGTKGIADYAFYNCSGLTSLTIPNSVTSIGKGTFYGCSGLTSVTIPNSVTSIGNSAFGGCSGLTSVTIPNSVTSIGNSAFGGCSGLTTVNFNSTNCTSMGSSYPVFSDCNANATINIGNGVTVIPDYAFYGLRGNGTLTIPNSVTSIGYYAFDGCSGLTSVTIGSGVTSIGMNAFYGCSGLTRVNYSGSIAQWCGITFNSQPLQYAHNLYINNSLVTNLVIPNTVTEIKYIAFCGATCLTAVNIPNSVTSIGQAAFYSCSGLTTVNIPISVTSIGQSAFYNCSGLTTVNYNAINCAQFGNNNGISGNTNITTLSIGENVETIPSSAFSGCSGLTTVNFNATNCASMGSSSSPVFSNCNANATINIGNGVTVIPDYAFYGLRGNGTLTIPNSVTSIGQRSFYNCSGLASVTIGNGISSIGNSAFSGCSGLTAVNFNATNCTTMGSSYYPAFQNCNVNTAINIGDNVTTIPDYAFKGLLGNGSLSIPNSVISIGQDAFYNCSGLTSVTIGSGITIIGNNAFQGCSGLTRTIYTGNIAQWCGITFDNIGAQPLNYAHNLYVNSSLVADLVVPNTVEEIKAYALYGATCLTSVTIPNLVTSIGNSAFYGCSELTAVNFNATNCTTMGSSSYPVFQNCNANATINVGEGVTIIPDYAFKGILGNGVLIIPSSVTCIGSYAFSGCSGLIGTLTIPGSVTSIGNSAFYGCSGLSTINFNATNCTSMGSSSYPVFSNCNANAAINIGEGVTTIPDYAFKGLSGNGIMIIPNSVTGIGSYAFSGCNGMTGALTIPNSVTSIGESAFYGCGGLSGTLTVPNSVASIGNSAFSGCSGLTTLNFNAENCTGTISGSLFDSNNTLSKITIGENVATIPNNAFQYCTSLDSIISAAPNPPVIYASTFDSQLSLNTPVVVPCGMVEAYEDADFWYNFRHIQQRADCGATYTIIVMSSNSAWGTVSGGGIYMAGETATLTATPNSGYSFSNWSDGSTENPHQITVTQNDTYIATFVQGGSSNPTVYNSIEATACGSYTWNNQTYTESGEYQQTFTAASSADSIVTLTLTILPAPQPTISLYGELDACNPSSVAFATEQYQSYQWSNGATTMITSTSVPGYYYVEVTGENGCSGISEQVCIGVSNAITEAPQISVVGMNSENHNVVAWSALDNENVNAYRIYRENNVANVYEPMATVEALQTTWTDSTADPTARAYRYKVTAVDECGGESPMSDYHKTMHLTINRGIGNAWNLIWSHYEGFTFGTYRIYRGTSPSNMTMIGEVPSNLNSYTDNTNTANEGFYYQVEVVRNTRSRDAEISSRSNIVDNGIITEYTITVISANPNRGTVTGGGTYPAGTVISIEAIANEGFEFASWSDENTDNPRQITVTENATYVASFSEISSVPEYTITVISANPNRGTVTGGGTYPEGTVISIEAIANEGFEFASWSDDNTDNPRQITVTENATFVASFNEISSVPEYTITVISANPNHGTVTGGGTYPEGTVITIEAIANEGFVFASWSDENTDNPRQITVTADATYIASFDEVSSVTEYTITVMSSNPNRGTVTGGGTYPEGTVITIEAIANEGFEFASWSDENTDNPRQITVTADATYIASFDVVSTVPEYTITVMSANPNRGTVTGGGTYPEGTVVTIEATALEGFEFVSWSDENTENPRQITVTADATYIASFDVASTVPEYTITVMSANPNRGTVTGGGTYPEGTVVRIEATALEGFEFVSWSDENTENPRQITVTADATYIASFEPATGIEENSSLEIALFPNPATDILNITSSETISEIEIVNVMGQVVRRIEVNADNAVCDVEDLKAGVYMMRIHTEGTVVSQRKFVKE